MPKAWLRAGSLCVAVLISLPFIFRVTSSGLVAAWNGTTAYNYCFLILPICAYLVWERRDRLLAVTPTPNLLGFALLLTAGVVWLLGELSGSLIVSEFALVAMAQFAIIANLGTRAARTLLFPLFYLLFLVPMGESLIPPLQTITARFAVALLDITGIPVRLDGLVIRLPNATWLVAEACAGVKFLIASVALGSLLSTMFLRSWSRRAVLMALSVVIPIVANGFRAYVIAAIGYFTDNAAAASADHILYGWLLFALVMLGMVVIAVLMREPEDDRKKSEVSDQSANRPQRTASPFSFLVAAACSLLILVSFKASAEALSVPPANGGVPSGLPLSVQDGWTAIDATDPSPPTFLGADRVWNQAYSDGSATVYLSLGYFSTERPGAEVATSRHQFAGTTAMQVAEEHRQDISVAQQMLGAEVMTLSDQGKQRLLWHWLWVDGRYTGNLYFAKVLQLKVKLLGGPAAAAIISISTDYAGDEQTATLVLARFVSKLGDIDPAR